MLTLVHVAIIAHIVLWLLTGSTLSPVEPSESMQTLREGIVNAGFVFFSLAILSTLILGRWFCGWACHMVAFQDLCAWLMMKVGVKPKPFRSRLLVFVPTILALYMFVWPVVHREVLRPLLMDEAGRLPRWIGQSDPLPGISTEFFVRDFWATFGAWYMAAPFLLVCTFGAVYFLGAKGFCTYGCPYGGFFSPSDLFAVGKIRVTDACHQCGHCTAVCTSNVRVHEEVRDFGMVVDPGCMKCMDCVSVCPNEALYFGVGAPAILAKPKNSAAKERRAAAKALRKARFELAWWEELIIGVVFLLYFSAYRGMANKIPMLMAVAMAGIMAFCTWKLWTMRPVALGGLPNSRLQNWQLRYRGKVRPAGWLLAAGTVFMMAVAAWSGTIRIWNARAEAHHAKLTTPANYVLSRLEYETKPDELAAARESLRLFQLAGPPSRGGYGWNHTADQELAMAWLHIVLGEDAKAEEVLNRIIVTGRPRDPLVFQVCGLLSQRGAKPEEIAAIQELALSKHPELDGVRGSIAARLVQAGKIDEARNLWLKVLEERPHRPEAVMGLAEFSLQIKDVDAARKYLAEVQRHIHKNDFDLRMRVARLLQGLGDRAAAIDEAKQAAAEARFAPTGAPQVAAGGFLLQNEDRAGAAKLADEAVEKIHSYGVHTGLRSNLIGAAQLLVAIDRARSTEALKLFAEAVDRSPRDPWELLEIGSLMVGIGTSGEIGPMANEGVKVLEKAAQVEPASGIIHSRLAMAYAALGRYQDALRTILEAAKLSPRSVVLARLASELLANQGRAQEAVTWEAEAKKREAAAAASRPAQQGQP